MATCFFPAKKRPVPTSAETNNSFSTSVRLNAFPTISIVAGACLRSNWMEALVTIGLPYGERKKSSTSWVIVVTPK